MHRSYKKGKREAGGQSPWLLIVVTTVLVLTILYLGYQHSALNSSEPAPKQKKAPSPKALQASGDEGSATAGTHKSSDSSQHEIKANNEHVHKAGPAHIRGHSPSKPSVQQATPASSSTEEDPAETDESQSSDATDVDSPSAKPQDGHNKADDDAQAQALASAKQANEQQGIHPFDVIPLNDLPDKLSDDQVQQAAKRLDPDIMDHVPAEFSTEHKNPCWQVAGEDALRCLPYFYITGGFQSGAYDLWQRLAKHPNVPSAHNTRMHFWGEPEKQFKDYVEDISRSVPDVSQSPQASIIGDASESTFAFYWAAGGRAHRAFGKVMVPCWQNCTQADPSAQAMFKCMNRECYPEARAKDQAIARELGVDHHDLHLPTIMRAAYGKRPPKLVMMVRNPIERLHDAFWQYDHYQKKYGEDEQGFQKYVMEQTKAFDECISPGRAPAECALMFEALGKKEEDVFFHCDQLIRGMYSVFLEHWLANFPKENILVIRSEDYAANETLWVAKVLKFLGLPEPSADVWGSMRRQQEAEGAAHGRQVLPAVVSRLREFYRPWNERLANVMQDPRYLYDDSRVSQEVLQKYQQAAEAS